MERYFNELFSYAFLENWTEMPDLFVWMCYLSSNEWNGVVVKASAESVWIKYWQWFETRLVQFFFPFFIIYIL